MNDTTVLKNKKAELTFDKSTGLLTRAHIAGYPDHNLVDRRGAGRLRYTLIGDDITTDEPFTPYKDKSAEYDSVEASGNVIECKNTSLSVKTVFTLKEDRLDIVADSASDSVSQFGIELDLNFLSKKNGTYLGQIIPTSPYVSSFGDRMYYIMPIIGDGYLVAMSKTPGAIWKIDYSPYSFGHFINNLVFLSSVDRHFGKEGKKHIEVTVTFAKSEGQCIEIISRFFDCPIVAPRLTGSFDGKLDIDLVGNADTVKVTLGEKSDEAEVKDGKATVSALGFGRHTVIPFKGGERGIDCELWFASSPKDLFEKCLDSVEEQYHLEDNLCEGMAWCWAMLAYMDLYGENKYLPKVEKALRNVMCEEGEPIPRHSIVPYAADGFPPYHICRSKRVQEQFFGISILTDMYKVTKDEKYLDFAVKSAFTVIETYQTESGAIVGENDYTTVCAPIIPIVDLAVLFKDRDFEKYEYFKSAAKKMAEHLLERGLHFPTEGIKSDINDEEMEDGSISCTALSVLYYCKNIENNKKYIAFAKEVLKFHESWTVSTPDVRLYRSSMRWWENIWEGDANGPAICGGHAWTIWRAEADYLMGELTGERDYSIRSYNAFMTNLAKICPDGRMYACYQPDFFPGGGDGGVRETLPQMTNEDIPKKYGIFHGYPRHFDSSLSRYMWVRAAHTWLQNGRNFKI